MRPMPKRRVVVEVDRWDRGVGYCVHTARHSADAVDVGLPIPLRIPLRKAETTANHSESIYDYNHPRRPVLGIECGGL